MEGGHAWHAKAINREHLEEALQHLGLEGTLDVERLLKKAQDYQTKVSEELAAKEPTYSRNYWWNCGPEMKASMVQPRQGLGKALAKHGGDARIVALGTDISQSIGIDQFFTEHPERKNRWLSMGIAEQSTTCVAAGLAKEGKLPIFGSY